MNIPFERSNKCLLLAALLGAAGTSQAAGLHAGWCIGVGNKHVISACTGGSPQAGTDQHAVTDVNHPPNTVTGPISGPTPQVVMVPTEPGPVLLELQSPQLPQQASAQTQTSYQPVLRPRPLVPGQTPSVVEGPGSQFTGGPVVLGTEPGRPALSINPARPPVVAPPGTTTVLQPRPVVPPLQTPPVQASQAQPPLREPSPQQVLVQPTVPGPTLQQQTAVQPPVREPNPQTTLLPPPVGGPGLPPQPQVPPPREPSLPQVLVQPTVPGPTLQQQTAVQPPVREPNPQTNLLPPPLSGPGLPPQLQVPPPREPSPQQVLAQPTLPGPTLQQQTLVQPPLREPNPQTTLLQPPLGGPGLPPQPQVPPPREPSPQQVLAQPTLPGPTLQQQTAVQPPLREPNPQTTLLQPPLQPPPVQQGPVVVTLAPGKPEVTYNPALPPQVLPPQTTTTLQMLKPLPERGPIITGLPPHSQVTHTTVTVPPDRGPTHQTPLQRPPEGATHHTDTTGQHPPTGTQPHQPPGGGAHRPGVGWVVPLPGRQPAHDLPTRVESGMSDAVVQCMASGFGWRRAARASGGWTLIGAHPQLRTADMLVRDIPANRHTHAGCVVEIQRRWRTEGDNQSVAVFAK